MKSLAGSDFSYAPAARRLWCSTHGPQQLQYLFCCLGRCLPEDVTIEAVPFALVPALARVRLQLAEIDRLLTDAKAGSVSPAVVLARLAGIQLGGATRIFK